jgi:alkylation response protein AidB-like acyl-CoA dehydrogenase
VDLLPSDEQQEIASAAAAFIAKELPTSSLRARRHEPDAIDGEVWMRCARLGWLGLGVPEALGGVGYGVIEEAMLFREIGRGLAPGPFLATSLAAHVAVEAGHAGLAGSLMEGRAAAALAISRDPDSDVGATVTGTFDLLDDVGAAVVLVVGPSGVALLDAAQLGPIDHLTSIDPASRLGRVAISGVETLAVPTVAVGEALFQRGCVLAAAMLAGIAEAARDHASEHARTRVQFGRPIGVHQAIKHRCADMALHAEAATAQVFFAAAAIDGRRVDAPFHASAAKVVATNAALGNAEANIQIHGGQGYTFGNDANLYLKRAHVVAAAMAPLHWHQARLLQLPPAE